MVPASSPQYGLERIIEKTTKHLLNRFFFLFQRNKEEPELKIKIKNSLFLKIKNEKF